MTTQSADEVFNEILKDYEARGSRLYGENVTEMEHALQTAASAESVNAEPAMVVACLLHDYGHLMHDMGEDIADRGVDAQHEELTANRLREYFPNEVIEPARLHVAAKRYLCGKRPEYFAGLSDASRRSLELQGGPMTAEEIADFECNPYCEAAIELRHHDDAGKVAGMKTKTLEDYRSLVTQFIKSNS